MTDDLANRRCEPCYGGVEPLSSRAGVELMQALHADWSLSRGRACDRAGNSPFPLTAARSVSLMRLPGLRLVEGHHPVHDRGVRILSVSYTTHAINGLSDNDFICAAKIDRLAAESV